MGGGRIACCANTEQPDRLKNEHSFPTNVVNNAAKLINKWFDDDELGMCRVVGMAGSDNIHGVKEPVMLYTHVDKEGNVVQESSSLPEVKTWVNADTTNL